MNLGWSKALVIARREYLTTIRRKAFLFTVLGTPALYAFLMFIMIKPQIGERVQHDASSGVLPEETAEEWGAEWLKLAREAVAQAA